MFFRQSQRGDSRAVPETSPEEGVLYDRSRPSRKKDPGETNGGPLEGGNRSGDLLRVASRAEELPGAPQEHDGGRDNGKSEDKIDQYLNHAEEALTAAAERVGQLEGKGVGGVWVRRTGRVRRTTGVRISSVGVWLDGIRNRFFGIARSADPIAVSIKLVRIIYGMTVVLIAWYPVSVSVGWFCRI